MGMEPAVPDEVQETQQERYQENGKYHVGEEDSQVEGSGCSLSGEAVGPSEGKPDKIEKSASPENKTIISVKSIFS